MNPSNTSNHSREMTRIVLFIIRYLIQHYINTLMKTYHYLHWFTSIFSHEINFLSKLNECSSRIASLVYVTHEKNSLPNHNSCLPHYKLQQTIGGGISQTLPTLNAISGQSSQFFNVNDLSKFGTEDIIPLDVDSRYKFNAHVSLDKVKTIVRRDSKNLIAVKVPIQQLATRLPLKVLIVLASLHHVDYHHPITRQRLRLNELRQLLKLHVATDCKSCISYTSLFEVIRKGVRTVNVSSLKSSKPSKRVKYQLRRSGHAYKKENVLPSKKCNSFPPPPNHPNFTAELIRDWCEGTSPDTFEEVGCAVCGSLSLKVTATKLKNVEFNLKILNTKHEVTRKERKTPSDPIKTIRGPVLDKNCHHVCKECNDRLAKNQIPLLSLANGNWIGDVPAELSGLSFTEKLLIARIRTNYCVTRVSSGMHKLHANAVLFPNPTPIIYKALPPHRDEIDQIMAFVYTGSARPTEELMKRTPLLVRRRKITAALEWLKLNHVDYADLEISDENIESYEDNKQPFVIEYHEQSTNKSAECTGLDDMESENGTDEGDCPFVVHGLVEETFPVHDRKQMIAYALAHMHAGGKALAISHSASPSSIFNNPQLYPQAFPWLFPYGLGGLSNERGFQKVPEIHRKRQLLLYHDKRFQEDCTFPLIAFNHEQIKGATTGGYLLTEKRTFNDVCKRLLGLNMNVLTDLANKLQRGERMDSMTEDEVNCFRIIKDLDHVASKVEGSGTTRKYMNNELWSMLYSRGAPTWYITFSPADVKHPICLHMAGHDLNFSPKILDENTRKRLLSGNQVASARFFHYMVQAFLKHVLGVGIKRPGLWGKTSAYYGTVEQQGRLTLHLHMLLWIDNNISPQEIRDKILDNKSDFQCKLVEYLEDMHQGHFNEGTMEDVLERLKDIGQSSTYKDPTMTLPESPPHGCNVDCQKCASCKNVLHWWKRFRETVDDIIFRSNKHSCSFNRCKNNRWKKCKARFPRPLFKESSVDPTSGYLNMRHGEAYLNTFHTALSYMIRCNSDVTSLLSGTAIKAVIAYITDYVTKSPLKTYSVFETIRDVFNKNSELLCDNQNRKDNVRRLMTKIVNSLTTKMQIGGPMAASYLLGLPDRYASHNFKVFYWKPYVREVLNSWPSDDKLSNSTDGHNTEKVILQKSGDTYVALDSLMDYMKRPPAYNNVALFDWIRLSVKKKGAPKPCDDHKVTKYDTVMHETLSDLEGDDVSSDDGYDTDNDTEHCESIINKRKLHDFTQYMEDVSFVPGHPQRDTHRIHMVPESEAKIPNILGGVLPRQDKGNYEYYCTTMLTLFKPWRSGLDLKLKEEDWQQAFDNYNFSENHRMLMRNFQVRYECNDARDDHSAQMKFGIDGQNKLHPYSFSTEQLDDMDASKDSSQEQSMLYDVFDDDDEAAEELPVGTKTYRNMNQILQAQQMLETAGWLDKLDEPVISNPDVSETDLHVSNVSFIHGQERDASGWKVLLQNKKDEVLGLKSKYIENSGINTPIHDGHNVHSFVPDQVRIVNQEYLSQSFTPSLQKDQKMIHDSVCQFNLRSAQERAFKIIANHAVNPTCSQLKMYIGGMAGTGKSQVIRALTAFFNERHENHRFQLSAPTGAAAALIGGSTFHSLLGLRDMDNKNSSSAATISKVKERIQNMEYLFIDEISMVGCRDLYTISKRLALALNREDCAFGGINVIVAGDFAQLPPVNYGMALYSGSVGTKRQIGQSNAGQEAALGKALWHQFTTVVILRENMRQQNQSIRDIQFRKCLENMRYARCTKADIKFLNTLRAGRGVGKINLSQHRFRNVSVIVGPNTYRDGLNVLGCKRFASDTGQKLIDFHSVDQWPKETHIGRKKRNEEILEDPWRVHDRINLRMQSHIWKLRPGATEHRPGILSLCFGMPVMLKNNAATECCVTNGAEAEVVGWKSYDLSKTECALDVLFVRLLNPPQTIQLEGLPENVVPINPITQKVKCMMQDDQIVVVSRSQIPVVPNFAMTDYASQGRTRPNNVVELSGCRSHMAYYTALSRSSSADGTVIVQNFSPDVITRGASGWLRQEFRELEILDDITHKLYTGKLVDKIHGEDRNTLIRQYRVINGDNYIPKGVHRAIRWSESDPFDLLEKSEDSKWEILQRQLDAKSHHDIYPNKKTKLDHQLYVTAKGSKSLQTISNDQGIKHMSRWTKSDKADALKRKNFEPHNDDEPIKFHKYGRVSSNHVHPRIIPTTLCPQGVKWDEHWWSCAYDSLLVILHNLWTELPHLLFREANKNNSHWCELTKGFTQMSRNHITFEDLRDTIRARLHAQKPRLFPQGRLGTCIHDVCYEMFDASPCLIRRNWHCQCRRQMQDHPSNVPIGSILHILRENNTGMQSASMSSDSENEIHPKSIQVLFNYDMTMVSPETCPYCFENINMFMEFSKPPPLLVLDISNIEDPVTVSENLVLPGENNTTYAFKLKGVIYHGQYHFTSRIIDKEGIVWYHDGIETGSHCINEGHISRLNEISLSVCKTRKAAIVIYSGLDSIKIT